MEKKVKVNLPSLPNYLTIQSGKNSIEKSTFCVSEFTEGELRELGNEWIEALIEHSKKRKLIQ